MKGYGANGKTYKAAHFKSMKLFSLHVKIEKGKDGKPKLDKSGNQVTRTWDWTRWTYDHLILFAALCKCDYAPKLVAGVGYDYTATPMVEYVMGHFPNGSCSDVSQWGADFLTHLAAACVDCTPATEKVRRFLTGT